jgi:hypothetical protein
VGGGHGEMGYGEECPGMGKQRMLLQTEFNLLLKGYFVQILLCKDTLNGGSLSTVHKLPACTEANMPAVRGKAKSKG